MKYFLTLKHWQMFGLIYLPPLLVYLLFIWIKINGKLAVILLLILFFVLHSLIQIYKYYLSMKLNELLPENLKRETKLYRIAFVYVNFYFLLLILIIIFSILTSNTSNRIFPFIILMILHLFTMISYSYLFSFFIKILKIAEKKRNLVKGDLSVFNYLFVFGPIGIWLTQPRINKIFAGNDNGNITSNN